MIIFLVSDIEFSTATLVVIMNMNDFIEKLCCCKRQAVRALMRADVPGIGKGHLAEGLPDPECFP